MSDGLTRSSPDGDASAPLLGVSGTSLPSAGIVSGAGARTVKRGFDIAGAATALIVLAPLLVLLMIVIRIESRGPALFTQVRLGKNRRPFRIFKLRTMQYSLSELTITSAPLDTADAPTPLTNRPDRTVMTRLGGFLRRCALDETPQLWNVLKGEMALVGPRPFVAQECEGLPEWSEVRFSVRPGITGLWQVCGQHSVSVEILCRLDVQYVVGWSLLSDLRILALTPRRLLRGGSWLPGAD